MKIGVFFYFLSIFLLCLELQSSPKNLSDYIVWFWSIYDNFKEKSEN